MLYLICFTEMQKQQFELRAGPVLFLFETALGTVTIWASWNHSEVGTNVPVQRSFI